MVSLKQFLLLQVRVLIVAAAVATAASAIAAAKKGGKYEAGALSKSFNWYRRRLG